MIQAYNYLLANYPLKREVLYPAKNKGELKRVYDNIVSLSNRSPFYKVNLSQENQEYTIGIKETALELKDKLANMQDPEISGFHNKSVVVSDDNILTAKLLNENTENLPDTIQIKVNNLADVQVNKGKDLLNTSFALPMGEYEFKAYVGDETYPLSFVQVQRMGNLDTLNNLAGYINKSVPGISAYVEKGASKNYSRLAISADMSGRYGDKSFSFDDDEIYGTGIVDFVGMNRVEKQAVCSDFELNQTTKQTATNTFNLENTLQISLKNSGDKTVTLKISPDSDKILTSVDSVISTYNSLISLAKSRMENNDEHYSASKLINEMQSMGKVFKDELGSVGIDLSEDGILDLNESKAIKASQEGNMESFFTRKNGFISRLMDKAEAIAINPVEYLEKTIVLYPNSQKQNYSNPYITSMYSGLLFSSYC